MAFERELDLARSLGQRAGQLALEYQRSGVAVEDKPDDSPVTVADRECEKLIAGEILRAFPDDGLLGEEGSSRAGVSGRRWIIDPIDGTRDYVRGNRLWCNLIALEVRGIVELGVCTFPALGESYWAARGAGAWRSLDGATARIHCSAIDNASRAVLCANGLQNTLKKPHSEKILRFFAQFWTVRSLGGALDAMHTCAGHADFWLEFSAKPWDLAAIQVIAQEAGLCYFDYTGADTIYGGNAVLCVPALLPVAREFLELPGDRLDC
jgi:fructose-1,6-bisphosphatase/inositol monophosphatase family enzyme